MVVEVIMLDLVLLTQQHHNLLQMITLHMEILLIGLQVKEQVEVVQEKKVDLKQRDRIRLTDKKVVQEFQLPDLNIH
tara:strand:+ start:223 stop:453 length:231 start_codon:yes stop_codon:yes gene_type:complete